MMFRFVGFYYLKYFFIVFLALEGFFLAIDTLGYANELPDSANLLVLFLFYNAIYALSYTLPISLLLCSVAFYMAFLRSNQLTALMALGYSKRRILAPLLIISCIFTLSFIALNATPFAYAKEYAESIIYKGAQNIRENLLLKSNNQYIFIRKLYPLLDESARAEGIKIFTLDERHKLKQYHEANEAIFESNAWKLKNAKSVDIASDLILGEQALKTHLVAELETLQGFSSKVLETIVQERPIASIADALTSLKITYKEDVGHSKIRALLYALIIVPFFVPLCIAIIAYYIPSLPRYGNLALISFICVIASLATWGILYALSQFSISGQIHPEFAILLPIVALVGTFMWHFWHLNTKFL